MGHFRRQPVSKHYLDVKCISNVDNSFSSFQRDNAGRHLPFTLLFCLTMAIFSPSAMNRDGSCIRGSDGYKIGREGRCIYKAMSRTLDQLSPESRGSMPKWLILTRHLFCLQEQLLEGSESNCKGGFKGQKESFKTKSNKKSVHAGNFFFQPHGFFSESFLRSIIIVVMFKKNKSSYVLEMHAEILTEKTIQYLGFALKNPEGGQMGFLMKHNF